MSLSKCAIDFGSNAIRAKIFAKDSPRFVRFPHNLGREVFRNSERSPHVTNETLDAILNAFAEIQSLASETGPAQFRCIATAAMRNCTRSTQICEMVRSKTGIEIQIIDGETEASLTWIAFAHYLRNHGIAMEERPVLADIGGGSTEITVGAWPQQSDARFPAIHEAYSLDMGSATSLASDQIDGMIARQFPVASSSAYPRSHLWSLGGGAFAILDLCRSIEMVEPTASAIDTEVLDRLQIWLSQATTTGMLEAGVAKDRLDTIFPATRILDRLARHFGAQRITPVAASLIDVLFVDEANQYWSKSGAASKTPQ